jgi:methanethiol S-methyltransferase
VTSVMLISGSFALWAIVHSLLASLRLKAFARRILGSGVTRWYRLFFVIVAVITLVPVLAAVALLPDRALYRTPAPWRWAMVLAQVGALVALAISVLQAGPMHFLGLAQLMAKDPEHTGELQVRGFYRGVRHPLYLFSVLLIWLTPVMSGNLATLFACMTLYFIVGSYHEEALLTVEFGEAYEHYRAQVPRFLPWPGRRFGHDR